MTISTQTTQATTPSKRSHLSRWLAWFIVCNAGLALLQGLFYLRWLSVPDATTAVYLLAVYIGQFSLLALLPGLLLLPLLAVGGRRLVLGVGVLLATLGQSLLALNTFVYQLYRFHLSGFVFEMALRSGTAVFDFSIRSWLEAGLLVLAILALQLALALALWRMASTRSVLAPFLALVLSAQLLAHGWHAWADANYDQRITAITRHVPLYYAATGKRFMDRVGLVDQQRAREAQFDGKAFRPRTSSELRYPLAPLECSDPENPLNILVVLVDGLRWDMVDPRWMPNLHALARQSLDFRRHYSNGNSTQPGVFSLFYGLPASYWDAFTATTTTPVLLDRLQALGYTMQVLSSAPLVSPAFDKNVFAGIADLRLRTPGARKWDRDVQITDDWLAFMDREETPDNRPFFGVLFYDTPHGHKVAPDYPVRFLPAWDPVDKLQLGPAFDPELMKNNYRTTLHFVDAQLGRVLEDLRTRGLLASTLILVTGDHGQEFNEHGLNYWDHGSNFGPWQLRVPLVLHWPGRAPAVIDYRTEHFDVAPTLLGEVMGCEATDPRVYATGNSLLHNDARSWAIAHSYMDYAVLLPGLQVRTYPYGKVEVLDEELSPMRDYRPAPEIIAEVLRELSRFYR